MTAISRSMAGLGLVLSGAFTLPLSRGPANPSIVFTSSQTPDYLADARRAIGGERRLNSIVLAGSVAQGFDLSAKPLETRNQWIVQAQVPDRYRRIEIDREIGFISEHGVSGAASLRKFRRLDNTDYPAAGAFGPEYLVDQREQLALLMLGLAADSRPVRGAQVQRISDRTLRVSGDDGFDCFIDFGQSTPLPVSVRYQSRVSFPQPARSGAPRGQRQVRPVIEQAEVTLSFSERSSQAGFMLPSRIVVTARGIRFEDIVIERFDVNPPLSAADFTKPISR